MTFNKKNKDNSQGFTVVELLVVISVIAVLASIVLFNITPYIGKARNAAIKANMSTVLVNSTFYFDQNASYRRFCADSSFTVPQAAIASTGAITMCNVNTAGDAVCACSSQIGTDDTFCVDHTGNKKESNINCAIVCPALSATCQ